MELHFWKEGRDFDITASHVRLVDLLHKLGEAGFRVFTHGAGKIEGDMANANALFRSGC